MQPGSADLSHSTQIAEVVYVLYITGVWRMLSCQSLTDGESDPILLPNFAMPILALSMLMANISQPNNTINYARREKNKKGSFLFSPSFSNISVSH